MNEIATCPVCGQELTHLEPLEYDTREFFDCLNFDCFFRCSVTDMPRIAAAMNAEARHNALVEAVAKMLITDDALYDARQNGDASDEYEIRAKAYASARAEVDRLIADCKGEG